MIHRILIAYTFFLASSCVMGRYYIPLPHRAHAHRQLGGSTSSAAGLEGLPVQCTTSCTAISTATQTCSSAADPTTCICTALIADQYQACLNCLSTSSADDSDLGPAIQQAVDVLNNGCALDNIAIPALTVPQAATPAVSTAANPIPIVTTAIPESIPLNTVPSPSPSKEIIGGNGLPVSSSSTTDDVPVATPVDVEPASTQSIAAAAAEESSGVGEPITAPSPVAAEGTSNADRSSYRLSGALATISIASAMLLLV